MSADLIRCGSTRGSLKSSFRPGQRDTVKPVHRPLRAAWGEWALRATRTQQCGRQRLVGTLLPFLESNTVMKANIRVFREELAKLGWSTDDNIKFYERWTTDNMDLVGAAPAKRAFCRQGRDRVSGAKDQFRHVGGVGSNFRLASTPTVQLSPREWPLPADLAHCCASR
jgi:hypothetical protein